MFNCNLSLFRESPAPDNSPMPFRTIDADRAEQLVYLERINKPEFDTDGFCLCKMAEYAALQPLFEKVFCVPSTSAPVERVFSQSGLIMRPHRARMSDSMLETLMFLKCNSHL